jgi:membrane peptidoglycan carboxypeptidase
VVDQGSKMGITTWGADSEKTFGLSLTLGGAEIRPIDMAQVYATFANNGLKIPLVAITRIVDAEGNVLEDYKVPQGEQVIDPRAAFMITNVLTDPSAKLFTYGPDTPLVLRQGDGRGAPIWPAASKTGTTDNYRDTWTDGYTPNLAIVVWVGNTDGRPMREVLSSMTAGKIWPEAMKASFDYLQLKPEDFPRPDGLVERQVCGDTAMRPGAPLCRSDVFLTENAPRGDVNAGPVRPPQPTPQPGQPTPAPAQAQPTPPPPPAQPTQAPPPAAPPPAQKPQAQPTAAPKPQAQPTPAAKPQPPQPTPVPKPR